MVKTPHSQCRVHAFHPWWGNKIPYATQKDQKKKKKKPNKQKPPNGREWKHLISHDESAQYRHTEGHSPSLGDLGLVHLSSAVNVCLITSLGCREDAYKVQKKHESQYQALISNHHHASDTYKGVTE